MPERQVTVRATRDQIKEFKESILWKDIKRELGMWRKGFRNESKLIVNDAVDNNLSTASVLLHMGDLDGRVKAVDYLLSLPSIFLQILEDNKIDDEIDQKLNKL